MDTCATLSRVGGASVTHCHTVTPARGAQRRLWNRPSRAKTQLGLRELGQTPRKPYGAVRSSLGLSFPVCNTRVIARVLITTQLNTD